MDNNLTTTLDLSKYVPPGLTIPSLEHILHRNGLPLESKKSYPKRKLLFNPIIVFTLLLLFLTREVVILSLDKENALTFKVLGSVAYLIGTKQHLTSFMILLNILRLSIQSIYYYNYRNGINPTFLRVFQMMSGSLPPKSLGLTDEQQIRKLLRTTRRLVKFLEINNNRIMPFCMFSFVSSVYWFHTDWMETLGFGLPNAIIFILLTNYLINGVFYQLAIIFIIGLYLRLKINALNQVVNEMKRRKRFIRIRETLQSFDSLYSEINEYNKTYLSKILFVFWTLFATIIVFHLYICSYVDLELFIKLIVLYSGCVYAFIFASMLYSVSSVSYSANQSYKTLNSFIISYSEHNKHFYYTRTSNKLKVLLF